MDFKHVAIDAALNAGAEILKIYEQDFDIAFKADQSPLTTADKAAHEIIVHALSITPFPVLSEESVEVPFEERRSWETYWLVDPLDGTKEFIKKNGEFTVNIALIKNGVPILGVVFAPVLDVIYVGSEKGAFKTEHCTKKGVDEIIDEAAVISVSQKSLSSKLRVVASRSHCNDETRHFIDQLEQLSGETELVSSGSSLKLCMIADGSADIYPRIAPTMEWDTAAAQAVVTAAGGQVFKYDPELNVSAYRTDEKCKNIAGQIPEKVVYNKENLLNPHFVACGVH